MRLLFLWIAGIVLLITANAGFAAGHGHHPKHNMVLFGEKEIFASHIVYKQPHNYQVILRLTLPNEGRSIYLAERARHPKARFIYLLDEMHIGDIEALTSISGTIQRVAEDGSRVPIVTNVRLTRDEYEILFFNELPLDLTVSQPPVSVGPQTTPAQ